jgi:LysM repeat protein
MLPIHRRRHPVLPTLAAVAAFFFAAAPAPSAAAQSPCGEEVTVTAGDTLYAIAQRCRTTVQEMVRGNQVIDDPDVLEDGWVLEVPRVDPNDRLGSGRDGAPASEPGEGDAYTVQPGDTLAEIAARAGVGLATLVAANAIDDPDLIRVGQEILFPDGGRTGRAESEVPPLPGPPADARVAIAPGAGLPGTAVTVTASGFPPGARVHVGAGPAESEYEVLERLDVGPDGRLRASVALPEWADPRQPWVFVVSTPDHRVEAKSERFDVLAEGGEEPGGEEPDLVTVRGTITDEGTECPALRTAEGELYTLTGDLGELEAGDRVVVEGTVAEVSICMQGTTLNVESIEPLGVS